MDGYSKTNTMPEYKRYCKVLKLQDNPELLRKYKEVHKPENLWPIISEGIQEVGIIDMEIYIKDNTSFMIMDTVPDFDHDKAMNRKLKLSMRATDGNPNHHLWNNNGTWYVHYTVHPTPLTKSRVRASLGTKDVETARQRRDELLKQVGA